jgi:cytoskeletal protein CcmA (bactofilin family)
MMTGEWSVSEPGVMVIGADTGLKGQVHNCRRIEINGAFEGELNAGTVIVHRGGRCLGAVNADTAEVHGNLEGVIRVRRLIAIKSSGSVSGNVQYGSLSLDPGGELSAEVRNVPPTVSGDFAIEVQRGKTVRITPADLNATDADDTADQLRFSVIRITGGSVVLAVEAARPVNAFTQADLAAGRVLFQHDGSPGRDAGFEVVVTDSKGATSGAPRAVRVTVI